MKRLLVALVSLLLCESVAVAQTTVIGAPNRIPIDCSGTIASGTTSQPLLDAAKTDLHGFCLQNVDSSEFLGFSFNGAASATAAVGSYMLQPASSTQQGGSFCSPTGMGVKLNPQVNATTTGHKYSCTWW